ncbi:hypothetical protein D0Y65_002777 [Glycine soja]|uniref:Uncharacterized protein n=1 Tax=Glycine soja TaxID=3848 RepID=A0A445LIM7_GLYSO|nr:hypothetical protein D0Y65_002777 [Glycine soja]
MFKFTAVQLIDDEDVKAGPTSLTQPNESEFTAEPDLPNEELGPISKDKDKILHNQPQKDHGKKLSMFLQ